MRHEDFVGSSTEDGLLSKKLPPEKYAFIVAACQYNDKDIPSAKYADDDAQLLQENLGKMGFHVTLLGAKGVYATTKENIEKELGDLCKKIRVSNMVPKDDFFFAFIGHGLGTQSGGSLFCPIDMNGNEFRGQPVSPTTAISLQSVIDQLSYSRAKTQVIYCDACRNGTRGNAEGLKDVGSDFISLHSNQIILQSCSSGSFSESDNALAHGIYTYFFMKP